MVISLALVGCNVPGDAELDTPDVGLVQENAAPAAEADGKVTAMAGYCYNGYKAGLYCNSSTDCGKFCTSGPKVNQYCNTATDCSKWCASGPKVNQYCNSNADCLGSTCVSTTCIQATCSG